MCRVLRNLKSKANQSLQSDGGESTHGKQTPHDVNEMEDLVVPDSPGNSPPPNKLRVLAYSDSDSDVESHAKQVKELLPNKEEPESESTLAEQAAILAEAAAQAAAEVYDLERDLEKARRSSSSSASSIRRLSGIVSSGASSFIHHIRPVSLIAGLLTVQVAGRALPLRNDVVERGAFVVGSVGSVVLGRVTQNFGAQSSHSTRFLSNVARCLGEIGKGGALSLVLRAIVPRVARRVKGPMAERLASVVDLNALENALKSPEVDETLKIPPESAPQWAKACPVEVREMKRMLAECGVDLSSPRWDDAGIELMRFAMACGLPDAQTSAARGAAIESAVRRIIHAVEYETQQPPLADSKLRRWERLVAWRGSDASGNPILLVRLGRALQLCTKTGRLETFAHAVVSQVAKGVKQRLNEAFANEDAHWEGGDVEIENEHKKNKGEENEKKIVAVIDCRETSNWEALTRSRELSTLAKKVAAELAAHYPGRLERIYLLELPLLARMGAQSIISVLSKSTRDKIVAASSSDESLPVTVAILQKRRSYARGLGRSRSLSDVSLATTEASEAEVEAEASLEVYESPTGEQGVEGRDGFATPRGAGVSSHSVETSAETPDFLSPQQSWISAAGEPPPLMAPLAMLSSMLPSMARSPVTSHRIAFSPGVLSKESSLGSPRPSYHVVKGGLYELPPRMRTQKGKKTPMKSSLRRTESDDVASARKTDHLGSFPLRRQSSVSWAENLERIREISWRTPLKRDDEEGKKGLSPLGATKAATSPSSVTKEPLVKECEEENDGEASGDTQENSLAQKSFPAVVVLLMAAGLLQRLLVG